MRNPQGTEGYTGAWSDSDSVNMTDAAKTFLKHTAGNDGVFFMHINDFKLYISTVVVGLYKDNWITTNYQENWNRVDNLLTRQWLFNNTVRQDVSFGFIGAYRKHMSTPDCLAPERSDLIQFSMKNLNASCPYSYMTDGFGKQVQQISYVSGNGWMNFNLAPG